MESVEQSPAWGRPWSWAAAADMLSDDGWEAVLQDVIGFQPGHGAGQGEEAPAPAAEEELAASQPSLSDPSLAELSDMAEACRSATDDSDSLPDNSLWWVNLIKSHASGHSRPQPCKVPRTVLSACSGSAAELMVLKVGVCTSNLIDSD